MTIRFNPPTSWAPNGRPYHHGVIQPDGKVLHISGQVAWDSEEKIIGEGNAEAQARQAFDNVEHILRAVGGRLEDIVSLTIFYVNPIDVPAIQKVRGERLQPEHGPAIILIQAAALIAPEFLVEVAPIAVIPEDRFHEPRW